MRLATAWAGTAAAGAGVLAAARSLPAPPLLDPAQLGGWARSAGPAAAAASSLCVTLAVALLLWVLALAAATTGCFVPAVARLLPATVTRFGLGVSAVAVAGAATAGCSATHPAAASGPPGQAPVLRLITAPPPPAKPARDARAPARPARTAPVPPATMAPAEPPLAPRATAPTRSATAPNPSAAAVAVTLHPPPPPGAPTGEWTVKPGDSLWSIAATVVGADSPVAPYWERLMVLNSRRLADPNLLFPGQTVLLPPTGIAPESR